MKLHIPTSLVLIVSLALGLLVSCDNLPEGGRLSNLDLLKGEWFLFSFQYKYFNPDGSLNTEGEERIPRNSLLEKWIFDIDDKSEITKHKDSFPYGDILEQYAKFFILDVDEASIVITDGSQIIPGDYVIENGKLLNLILKKSNKTEIIGFAKADYLDQVQPLYLPDEITITQLDDTDFDLVATTYDIDADGYVVYTFTFRNNYAQQIQSAEIDVTYMQYNGGWGANKWFYSVNPTEEVVLQSNEAYTLIYDDLWYITVKCRSVVF